MSMLAAEKYGADVTCYGLVKSQNDAMRMLMKSRNFRGKLTLVEKDHRELQTSPPARIAWSACADTANQLAERAR
jgi:hypothetical protein